MSGDAANDYLGAGLAESLITSLAAVPQVTVLSRSRGGGEPPAESRSRQLRPVARRELHRHRLGASGRRSAARDAEPRAAGRLGGVGRNGGRADRAICSTLQTRLATAAGQRDRRSNAVGASAPSRRRRSPAASRRRSRIGRAARCSIAATSPATCRPRSRNSKRAIAADPKFAMALRRPRRSAVGDVRRRPTTRPGPTAAIAIDRDARSSSSRIGRACATSPALTLFRGGQYRRGASRSRARARAAADLRGRDPAARDGADAAGQDRRGPRGIPARSMAHSPERGGGAHRHGRSRCTTRRGIRRRSTRSRRRSRCRRARRSA